ncbi:MAG: preprotein translocase subunit SecG [Candidatus Eremiobacteraeota bacterium]|nr:preprotein translocase subunit SecG [Candidatus Eremiobacteraeota bacterium]
MAAKAPAASYGISIWQGLFLVVYFLVCVGLVVTVLLQTTKSEGLSGIIGGAAQSVFKGKKGFEDRLKEATTVLAVSFIVLSLLLSIVVFRK